jgi:hypothetical protein
MTLTILLITKNLVFLSLAILALHLIRLIKVNSYFSSIIVLMFPTNINLGWLLNYQVAPKLLASAASLFPQRTVSMAFLEKMHSVSVFLGPKSSSSTHSSHSHFSSVQLQPIYIPLLPPLHSMINLNPSTSH